MDDLAGGVAGEGASAGGRVHLVLTVPADAVELAADRLWQCGAGAVEERPVRDVSRSPSLASGDLVELWTVLGEAPDAIVGAELRVEPGWGWRTVRVASDPTETWRDHVEPIDVAGRLVVVPAWRDDLPRPADRLVLNIEPGAAFGLGDHPTTQLSLAAVLDVFDELQTGEGTDTTDRPRAVGRGRSNDGARAPTEVRRLPRVLDVGTGSGVLAIAAARLGAASVRAIDVAPAAIEATLHNARRNGVERSIRADRSPCGAVTGSFDLVLANILAPTLIALADDLRRLTASSGRLVVSGVLSGRHDHVVAALEPMVVDRIADRDGWAAITLRHR